MNVLDILFYIVILVLAFAMLFGSTTVDNKKPKIDFVKVLALYIIFYTVYNISKFIL